MTKSSIIVDYQSTKKALNSLEKTQYPFALAKTLTETAKAAQGAVRANTRKKFVLHTKFILNKIKIIPSRKSDVKKGIANSAVYTDKKITKFMVQHEPGAMRSPISAQTIAVPGPDLKRMGYQTAGGKTKKKFQPSTLLKDFKGSRGSGKVKSRNRTKKAFIITGRSGLPLIVRRTGNASKPLELLYILKKRVRIRKTWFFVKTVNSVAEAKFLSLFKRNMQKAVETTR